MAPRNHDEKYDSPVAAAAAPAQNPSPSERKRNFFTHLSMDEDSVRNIDRSQYNNGQLINNDATDYYDDHRNHHHTTPQSRSSSPSTSGGFLHHFLQSSGPPQIITLSLLIALSFGSIIGVVPSVVEDRYARLHHGYDGVVPCTELGGGGDDRPRECLLGNEDAQNAAAMGSFVANGLTFVTSSLMGSISDEKGRRGILLLGIGLSLLGPLNLVLLQLFETMDPFPYYASAALSGLVSYQAIFLSALSDVMPPQYRAPAFGLFLAGFSMGFALSPLLAVFLSHLGVSILALSILIGAFIFACVFLPETLSVEASERARSKRLAERPHMETRMEVLRYNLQRPVKELLILNRNKLFRLLAALAFFSGVVGAADQTLFLYYVVENFHFGDKDIATLFLILGCTGMFVQGVLLKPLNGWIGERRVVIMAFLVGAIQNYLYGSAQGKSTIFVAATIASLTGMSFPTISAIKANNVDELEQGRVQGALFGLSSLASALGPMMLRYVYSKTKDGGGYGKGTMFIFGAGLYLVATVCAWLLPEEQANSNLKRDAAKKRSSLVGVDADNFDYGAVGDGA
mmetsp:Transcript_34173/g.65072  ORF Transcript_34173/g.65072 Transcript_34173/m.65072 type:complete len:571 (-) Transcript_34173:108-1820(-)|eukprot:CAMPEP_0201648860 /NCGR_PEP_ID=MMETSP0493-20130528/38381_1 /ASSEMBLY_ACC=CAM_ASM_000838 /TAXON_ID=420259 /ORGANISM="Thalassiosira gravida, Strain GMp14c1" /LENGTH=570 /DNA_ID=CAMNT_0048124607 /DNA_START=21 /DNA_END=1733 /DNA_ORIENTATION=-